MKYEVDLTDTACDNADAAYEWIKERSPSAATKWFNGLLDVVESLEMFPTRCGIAPESEKSDEEISNCSTASDRMSIESSSSFGKTWCMSCISTRGTACNAI